MIICFDFLRNKNYVNKISSKNGILHKVLIKIYLQSFVFSYYFIVYLDSSSKIFLQHQHHIELMVHQ